MTALGAGVIKRQRWWQLDNNIAHIALVTVRHCYSGVHFEMYNCAFLLGPIVHVAKIPINSCPCLATSLTVLGPTGVKPDKCCWPF